MTPGSVIAATTRSSLPHVDQLLKSMANTRCNRAIALIGVVLALGADSSSVADLLAALRRATMPARSRALGANSQWYRTRWALGRGTRAAERAMKSSGSNSS